MRLLAIVALASLCSGCASGVDISTAQIVVFGLLLSTVLLGYVFIKSRTPRIEGEQLIETRFRRMFSDYPIVVILFGSLLLVVGVSLRDHGWTTFLVDLDFTGSVISEFGMALIIAFFISVSIEEYSRRRHNDNVAAQIEIIKRSVFESVYKSRYDRRFIDFIEDTLFKYPFYRRKYRVAMKISPHQSVKDKAMLGPEDPVVVSITLRSTIQNITSTARDRLLSTAIERSSVDGLANEPRLCSIKIGDHSHVFANDDEFKKMGRLDISDSFKRYSIPHQFAANESLRVEYQYTIIKFARDEMSWRCADPAEDFLLALSHTDKLVSFAAPMHNRRDIEPRRGIGGIDLELEIPDPLFPYNGAMVWWRPAFPEKTTASKDLASSLVVNEASAHELGPLELPPSEAPGRPSVPGTPPATNRP